MSNRRWVRYGQCETEDIVHAFVMGDPDALIELIRRYRHVPIAAARRQLHSTPEVEDVAQETWLRFALHAPCIREPHRLSSWLWSTATHEALRRRRREARQQLVDSFDDRPADQPEEAIGTPERCAAVSQAVRSRLTDEERALFELLIDARGFDYRQISRSCHRPIGAIGPTRARIIRKIQSHPEVVRLAGAA